MLPASDLPYEVRRLGRVHAVFDATTQVQTRVPFFRERIVWRKRRSWLDTAKRPRCSEQRRAAQPVESDSLARSKAGRLASGLASRLVGRRRTRHAACSAALRRRARPLSRATPATYEDVSGGAHATSGVVRRTSALGAGSFWRTWRPSSCHFFAESLFIGMPMADFSEAFPPEAPEEVRFVTLTSVFDFFPPPHFFLGGGNARKKKIWNARKLFGALRAIWDLPPTYPGGGG